MLFRIKERKKNKYIFFLIKNWKPYSYSKEKNTDSEQQYCEGKVKNNLKYGIEKILKSNKKKRTILF